MPTSHTSEISIPARFCGPPKSGNGGYSSGLLAECCESPCQVTLRVPPPLDTPLELAAGPAGEVFLRHGETLVAEAAPAPLELALPEPVSFADAERASRNFPGFHTHPFPRCFVCGTERKRGDGLALYPGAVASRPLVAAPWVPTPDLCDDQGRVRTRFTWAALDCPAWFGYVAFADHVAPTLLGRITSRIVRAPRRDEACVVLGWHIATERRRIGCAAAILDEHGACLAYSRSTWITLKPSE